MGYLDSILPYLRCPRCGSAQVGDSARGVSCHNCIIEYPLQDGILNMMADDSSEVITPFQRMMQATLVVSIYERLWRPLGYRLASSRRFSDEVGAVLRLHQETDGCRLLDLACGTGVFARPLARQSRGLVVGLDLSWPMLRRARRLADQEGDRNIVFIRGTVFRLPFVAGAFSSINCCGALHLFDQPDLALQEIGRVLRPAGYLSIQTTIRPNHSGGVAYFLERFVRFGFFDEKELRENIRLRGFEIIRSERHRISCTLLAQHAS